MTTARGQVYDIGYQRYTGIREGRSRARMAVYTDGVRAALGIGRGGRAKILPWAFIVAAMIPALVMALVAGAANRLVGEGTSEQLDLPSHADYYGIASIILFLFAAVVGPELLCPDRRSRVIDLYLVRPLSGDDYVVARWLAFFTIMLIVTWLPQFVLLAGLSLGAADTAQYFKDNWLDIPRFLAAGLVLALYVTTLAMMVASFTNRRAYASAVLIGLFVISSGFAGGLSQAIGGTAGKYIALFNLTNIPVHVNDIIFDRVSAVSEASLAHDLPAAVLIAWWAAWVIGPGAILWQRYRRLTA